METGLQRRFVAFEHAYTVAIDNLDKLIASAVRNLLKLAFKIVVVLCSNAVDFGLLSLTKLNSKSIKVGLRKLDYQSY